MWRKSISTLFLIATLAALAFIFFFYNSSSVRNSPLAEALTLFMFYYLSIVFVRTMLVVVLSFFEFLKREELELPSHFPLVSVIIPSFNEEKVIANAISSITKLDYPNLEVLIVDDGSLDLTTSIAKKFEQYGGLRVIYKENGGKADALNRGLSEALGTFILCVDADSILKPDVLLKAIGYLEKHPDVSAVAGRVEIGNDHNTLLKFQRLEYITSLNLMKRAQSYLGVVTVIPGPIGVFRAQAIRSVGGYHLDTFAEDADLSMRLLVSGHQIKYLPEIVAVTEGPETLQQFITQRYRWSRGMVQAINKHSGSLKFSEGLRNFLVLAFMMSETILIPVTNFVFMFVSLQLALVETSALILGEFFISLIILDVSLTIFSTITERKSNSFLPLSAISRVTYGLALEIIRFFSIIDELFGIPMKWGVLARKGLGGSK